jgi:hypothetical protein
MHLGAGASRRGMLNFSRRRRGSRYFNRNRFLRANKNRKIRIAEMKLWSRPGTREEK